MFDRNSKAFPCMSVEAGGFDPGPTFFQQCAKDFTAAAIPWMLDEYEVKGAAAIQAAEYGILAAEAFCARMEEREK